jgi:hypothetical protein
MATRSKPNWKVLDPLLLILEKEGWSHAQIADDWGISTATLERHLTQEVLMGARPKHDYDALIEEYEQRLASGESKKSIEADFDSRGIHPRTFQNNRTAWHKAHPSTPQEHHVTPEVHPSTPYEAELLTGHQGTPEHLSTPYRTEILPEEQDTQEHPGTIHETDPTEVHHGTLEEYQEVMDEVHQSVPDAPHISTEPSILEHPSTPIVNSALSPDDSSAAHSGVPARQEHLVSTPMVHPGTPTAEDWELWSIIKARWLEVEKMLADRQALLSTPSTPGHTQKKTYVFDVRHIAMIEQYAANNRLDLKDVIYAMCQEFFQSRGYAER